MCAQLLTGLVGSDFVALPFCGWRLVAGGVCYIPRGDILLLLACVCAPPFSFISHSLAGDCELHSVIDGVIS